MLLWPYSASCPASQTPTCARPMLSTAAQGCKDPRLDGEEHMAAVEEFCFAAQKQFPNCLIQFEDFPTDKVTLCRSSALAALCCLLLMLSVPRG